MLKIAPAICFIMDWKEVIISIAKLEISYVIENIKAFSLATWITYLHPCSYLDPCYMTGADDTMGP